MINQLGVKVTPLKSPRTHKEVPNQLEIRVGDTVYFQSYRSIVGAKSLEGGQCVVYLDPTYWNYSRTTSKYRSEFLGESTKDTQKKIDSGEYRLVDLNTGE
jgi:hypothetical protein